METMKNRLDELEIRVQKLESELQAIQGEQKNQSLKSKLDLFVTYETIPNEPKLQVPPVREISDREEEVDKSAIFEENLEEGFSSDQETRRKSFLVKIKDNESLVGKYFIGALASLLIFIAAASFIAIVWNRISPQVKLATVAMVGLLLTAVGFKMTLRKASNVSSIVFGTGIGLVYISIVSANLVFSLISHESSALLCVLWTLMVLLSHRYTQLYFTIVIAAIGSFINLCFELGYVEATSDIMLIIAYTSTVAVMLLYMSRALDKVRNVISILFVFFNFGLIFEKTYGFWHSPYPLAQTVVTLIMVLVANWLYRLANRENIRYTYLIVAVLSTICLFLNIYTTLSGSNALSLTSLQASTLLFVVILAQCIVNHLRYPNIEKSLTLFYTFPLYIVATGINHDLSGLWGVGAVPIILLFVLRKKVWKKTFPVAYMMFFILSDLCFILMQGDVPAWTLFFNTVDLFLLFYILYEEKIENISYRNAAVAILLFSYFKISDDICRLLNVGSSVNDIQNLLAYFMGVITVLFVYKIGYLSSKDEEDFHPYKHMGLYSFSGLLYLFGMQEMFRVESVILRFIVMLATLVMALLQSKLLIEDHKEMSNRIGIWLVSKYFIFAWVMIRAFWELPFESLIYSVVALLLAVVAIYIGFKLSIKVIRHFGLYITLLMVAKFIFVDLQGENSITRVIAFAIGGVLCFMISIIYNRLSKE
ncbi:MAG: DUF2339 domain-containing protein [Filifactor alocis]|nr:DUF2339 domain-containing protein [Filifactor alocis]